jgi:hypothetical protein
MPRANRPVLAEHLNLFPPSGPEPDWASLPKEAREAAACLMARMLTLRTTGTATGGRGDE